MEDNRIGMFTDFSKQVDEICQHSDQVETVKFTAKLKNGTSFSFHYNKDSYEKSLLPKRVYQPLSVFGSIIDCAGAGISIACLVLLIGPIWHVLLFSMLLATFTFAALDHLFDVGEEQAHKVFSNLRDGFKILAIGLCNYCIASMTGSHVIAVVTMTFIIAATALLLLSMQTKGSLIGSLATTTLLSFCSLFSLTSAMALSTCILYGLWSVQAFVLQSHNKVKSNTIFGVMATVGTALLLLGWGA